MTVAKWLDHGAAFLARGCGIGFIPVAPGTFGSLPGLLLGAGIHMGMAAHFGPGAPAVLATMVCLAMTLALSLAVITRTEKMTGLHDDQRIVVDEIAGQAIAVAFVPPAIIPYVLGFALFRMLDIIKPSLIGKIDQEVTGPWGTLADDVLAGCIVAPMIYALSFWLAT